MAFFFAYIAFTLIISVVWNEYFSLLLKYKVLKNPSIYIPPWVMNVNTFETFVYVEFYSYSSCLGDSIVVFLGYEKQTNIFIATLLRQLC